MPHIPPRYTADQIEILEGLEPVRRRAHMYIGETGRAGMHRLLWTAIGHILECHFVGLLDRLAVYVNGDEVTIAGSRVALSATDAAIGERNHSLGRELESLFCGRRGTDAYETVGEYGNFLSITTALSSWLVADYRLAGERHGHREYVRGTVQRASEERHTFDAWDIVLRFLPDQQIFGSATFDYSLIAERLRTLSFLNPQLMIELHDGVGAHQHSTMFHHPDGLDSYVRHRVTGQTVRGEPLVHTHISGPTRVEIALQRTESQEQHLTLYLNSCQCPPGHPLEQLCFETLREAWPEYCLDADSDSSSTPLVGLEAIVSLWSKEDAWRIWHSGGACTDDTVALVGATIKATINSALA